MNPFTHAPSTIFLLALLGIALLSAASTEVIQTDCETLYERLRQEQDAVPLDELLIQCERAAKDRPQDAHQQYLYGKTLTLIAADSDAIAHFRHAAAAGHYPAQHELGLAHLYGRGVAYEPAQAQHWLERAAEGGYAPAQRELALLYQMDEGGERDLEEAYCWYRQVAEQDDVEAQTELALAYRNGRGVAKHDQQALTWLQRATQSGYPNAQYLLGMEYYTGYIVAQDYAQALKWMNAAAANGYGAAERGFFVNGLYSDIGGRN